MNTFLPSLLHVLQVCGLGTNVIFSTIHCGDQQNFIDMPNFSFVLQVLPNNALVCLVSFLTVLLLPSQFPVCNTASSPKRPLPKAESKSLRDIFSGHALNRTRRGASWPGVVLRYKTPQHKLYMKILYPTKLKSSTEVHKKTPVYVTRGNMYCRTGYYLRINSDGTVDGTTQFTSKYGEYL